MSQQKNESDREARDRLKRYTVRENLGTVVGHSSFAADMPETLVPVMVWRGTLQPHESLQRPTMADIEGRVDPDGSRCSRVAIVVVFANR